MQDHLISIANNATTYAIDYATATDHTVRAIDAAHRFVVYQIFIEAEGAVDVTIKSGSTALTGAINFAANDEKEWKNGGVPVFRGRALGDDFVITLSAAEQVNGFVVIGELTV
jgi:hypothetical protein